MHAPERPFRVHARDLPDHRARVVREPSFEAAAIAYAEEFQHTVDDDPQLRVIVCEVETGHERCFTVDLDTGATGDCA
jgi:hypothetical protein